MKDFITHRYVRSPVAFERNVKFVSNTLLPTYPLLKTNLSIEEDMHKSNHWINVSPRYNTKNNSKEAKSIPYLYLLQEIKAYQFVKKMKKDSTEIFVGEIYSIPPKRNYPTIEIVYSLIDETWCIDLADMSGYKILNNQIPR